MGLFRFGVSLEKGLLEKFDRLIRERNYPSRSKAIRDLIRQELVKKQWQSGDEVAGAITFVYDHHQRELVAKIIDLQHQFPEIIISTQHIHLNHKNCLEIVAVRGKPGEIYKLNNHLKALKGVKHSALNLSCTGQDID